MTYNVSGGTLNLAQSILSLSPAVYVCMYVYVCMCVSLTGVEVPAECNHLSQTESHNSSLCVSNETETITDQRS